MHQSFGFWSSHHSSTGIVLLLNPASGVRTQSAGSNLLGQIISSDPYSVSRPWPSGDLTNLPLSQPHLAWSTNFLSRPAQQPLVHARWGNLERARQRRNFVHTTDTYPRGYDPSTLSLKAAGGNRRSPCKLTDPLTPPYTGHGRKDSLAPTDQLLRQPSGLNLQSGRVSPLSRFPPVSGCFEN